MRVCLVCAEYAPHVGGLADYIRLLATHLSAAGDQVLVLTGTGCSGSPSDAFEVRGSVSAWNFGLFRALRQMADSFRPDVVHLQFQTAAYGMHPAIMLTPSWFRLRRPSIACLTTFHDLRLPYLFPKAHPVRRWLLRLMATQSAVAIATNGDDFSRLNAMGAATCAIPIGSNVARSNEPTFSREELAERWGVPADGAVIGFFGLLNRSKGFDTLLRAVRGLRDDGREVSLLMMGERTGASDPTNRAYGAEMDALVATLGLTDTLHWTGYLDEATLSRALRSVDVCALPFVDGASYRNGTLLAALTNGVPLVTTATAAVTDAAGLPLLANRKHALLSPATDAAALAEALAQLLDDRDLRLRLAENALELSLAFAWQGIAERHAALYRGAAAVPSAAAVP